MFPSWCPKFLLLTNRSRSARRRFRPRLERLEDRTTPAIILFDGDGDGVSWFDELNWAGDVLPGVDDVAMIDGLLTPDGVTFNGTAQINGIIGGDGLADLRIAGGKLTLTGSYALNDLTVGTNASLNITEGAEPVFGEISGSFINQGTVERLAGDFLTIGGQLRNEGVFLNTNAAGLSFDNPVASPGEFGLYNTSTGTMTFTTGFVSLSTTFSGFPTNYDVLNEGLLTVSPGDGGSFTFFDIDEFVNAGSLYIETGRLSIQASFNEVGLTQTNGVTKLGFADGLDAVLDLRLDNDGIVEQRQFAVQGGQVVGTGTIIADVIQTGGSIAPGFSPGIINITGDFLQSPNAVIDAEIFGPDGPGATNGHDLITVSGVVQLDGTLNLSVPTGFDPAVGSIFVLVQGPSIGSFGGTFATINGTDISATKFFVPLYRTGNFAVEVFERPPVPEEEPDLPPPVREEPPPPVIELPPPVIPEPEIGPSPVPPVQQVDFLIFPEGASSGQLRGGTAAAFEVFDAVVEVPLAIPPRVRPLDLPFDYGEAYQRNGDDGIGDIAGNIFTDYDGDGKQSRDEPYRAGQVVYLDVDGNGRFGEGEPWTVTDEHGEYRFRDVRPGTYQVRLDLGPKSERTYPKTDWEVTITTQVKEADDVDFAVRDRRLKIPVRPTMSTPLASPASSPTPEPVPETPAVVPGAFTVALFALGNATRRQARERKQER